MSPAGGRVPPPPRPPTPVQPQGVRTHGDVVLPPDFQFAPPGPRIQRKSLGPTQPGTLGKQRLAVILATFKDKPLQPLTPAQVQRLMFDTSTGVTNDFLKASYEQMWWDGTVTTQWYPLPLTVEEACGKDSNHRPDEGQRLVQAALTAADADVNYNEYDYVFVFTPLASPCLSGRAYVASSFQTVERTLTGRVSWLALSDNKVTPQVRKDIPHELSHVMGIYGHAGRKDCFPEIAPKSLWETCREVHRGDHYSVTGSNFSQKPLFNPIEIERLDWLLPGENIQSFERHGVFRQTIENFHRLSRQLKVVRVRRGTVYPSGRSPIETWYYVSYLYSSYLSASGVVVHTNFSPNVENPWDTFLLDMTPTTNTQIDLKVDLAEGQTFMDPFSKLTVMTLRTSPEEAELEISIPRDTVAPLVRFAGLQEVMVASSRITDRWIGQPKIVPLAVEAADNQQVTKVSFYADDTLLGIDDVPPFDWKWDVGELADRSSHRVKAIASDAANNTATVEGNVTVRVDQTQPTIRFVALQHGSILTGPDPVTIELDVQDRETGLAYVAVKRLKLGPNGSYTEEAKQFLSQPPYTTTWDLAQAAPGKYEIHVWAADHAGNWTFAFVRVEVRAPDTTPPVVSIMSPSQGMVRGAVPVKVAAYDPESGIGQVTISVTLSGPIQVKSTSAVVLASFTHPPYQTEWTPPEDGRYTLTVKAVNGARLSTTATLEVLVANRAQDLTIQRQGSDLVLTWSVDGALQSAQNISGPWNEVLYAKSPYTVGVTQAAQFYRLGPPGVTTVEPAAPVKKQNTTEKPAETRTRPVTQPPSVTTTPTFNPPALRPTLPLTQRTGDTTEITEKRTPPSNVRVIRSRRTLSRR